jgi:hypothetical protein
MGEKSKISMQRKPTGKFYITAPASCPAIFQKLEPELKQAILEYGKSIGAD